MNVGVLVLTGLFVIYGLFNRRLSRSPITGPMIFTAAGLAFAIDLIGSGTALETFALELTSETIQVLLEVTLVLVLFADAVGIDVGRVRREAFLPSRLLGIGLPLTIVAGTALAMLVFPGLGFWPAAVVAVVLAPTDAALGQAVVSNEDVPGMVRQGLAVESGLNDGIAVPFLTIAIAGAANEMQTGAEIARVFVEEIGLALLIGAVVGLLGALAVRAASARGWTGREGRQVLVVFLAILTFALADPVGGSGFIAAFVGGLTFGALIRRDHPAIGNFAEGVSHLLTMASFLVFGALILGPEVELIGWREVLYAVLSLTIVRMVPVALAMIGTDLSRVTELYVGWFGPRGLASLVFLGVVVIESDLASAPRIIAIGATAVGLSVVAHGITAWPLSIRYARWFRRMAEAEEEMMESMPVEHLPMGRTYGRLRADDGMWDHPGGR